MVPAKPESAEQTEGKLRDQEGKRLETKGWRRQEQALVSAATSVVAGCAGLRSHCGENALQLASDGV